ncbi:MAG: hypothetical protein IJK42_05085 [Prevotella sp.]|nr:hypothetical protein [Prevotella sp.]
MNKQRFLSLSMVLVGFVMNVLAQNIDFDFPGRNTSEVTEPNYISWPVGRVATETKTLENGMKITISAGEGASAVGSNWNKQTVQSGMRLVGDGVLACNLENGNIVKVNGAPTAIVLTIEGMTPGPHSVIAYHNNTDKNQTLPSIKVEVNGVEKATGVKYSCNSDNLKMSDVGRSFVEFEVVENQPVVIRYVTTPILGNTYTTTSVMLNGLEFDVNPYGIVDEYPTNHDYHVDADNGSLTFKWTGADVAVDHRLALGTDSLQVVNATDYQYEGTVAECTISGFSPLVRYWWRVDEVDASGAVYKGKVMTFQPRRLAFPGAEGYGRYAIGGRGGVVYHVTSLADDGTQGTLRYGIEKVKGPRTIVFDVAGVIALNSRLTVSDKFVTIAGQTAPGRGIMLRNKPFGMQSDGITRFIRMRLGGADSWDGVSPNENTADGMGMTGNDHAIMDHCSIAWTIDEGFSSRNARDMTLQRTIISEALNYAGHATQMERQGKPVEHGYAATISGGVMGSHAGSYHHNLMAHCEGRNWSMGGGLDGSGYADGRADMFNNVCYNWGGRTTDGGTHEGQFVNNYYKMGPASRIKYLFTSDLENVGMGTQSYYISGNVRENLNGTKSQDKLDDTYRYRLYDGKVLDWQLFHDEPFFPSYATIETAEAAFKNVLSDVGCNLPELDNHDQRMVNETLTGTTSVVGKYTKKKGLPDCESDAEGFDGLNIVYAQREEGWDSDNDGIPDWYEEVVGTDPLVANNNEDRDGDYYTDLEEYLNWIAKPNFTMSTGESLSFSLKPYFAGYTSLQGISVENGMAASPECQTYIDADKNLVVKSTGNTSALLVIPVKVSQDGINLTRDFHVAVKGSTPDGIQTLKLNDSDDTLSTYDVGGRKQANYFRNIIIQRGKKVVRME